MNFENPEPLSFVTPKGEFRYSWLVEPDTKFEKCEYKVEVLVPAEQGMELVEKLEALKKVFMDQAVANYVLPLDDRLPACLL